MATVKDVMERLGMDFRVTKLEGYDEYRVEFLKNSWFGLGKLKWYPIYSSTFRTKQEAEQMINVIRRSIVKKEKNAWIPTN